MVVVVLLLFLFKLIDIGRSSQICIRDKIRSIKQKHSPQVDNPVGLRPSDVSYLIR